MYVGDERVKPDTAVPLEHGDRVCFGVNMDSNDLKYELVCKGSTVASLCRCGVMCGMDGTLKLSPSATPPLVKGKRGLSEDQQSGTNRSVPMKKLRLSTAKEEMDEEKHKLLSSIEALRSELAAKDQLIAEKDEKAKVAEKMDNSVVSSMQKEFTCVICQELFINAYTLPCAHSFCEWCIKEWMKRKGHKDCPICRMKITSDPVHSLALDNAVDKLVEKLNADEQKERKETESQHKNALSGLEKPKTKAATVASKSRMTTRSSVTSSASPRTAARAHTAGPSTARRGGGTTIRSSPRMVIHIDESGRITTRSTTPDHPIVLDTSTESEPNSDEESDSSEESDESGSYDSGLHGAYYGGYGRCFNCGE